MGELKLLINEDLPLRDLVYHSIRSAILKGDLKPGDRLMEMHLAQQLGVSRTPIREAIHMLEEEGLTISIPRKGAHVAGLTLKDMEDIFEIRKVLEVFALEKICKDVSPDAVVKMRFALKIYKEAMSSGEIEALVDKDADFHGTIYEATSNHRLHGFVTQLRELLARYRWEVLQSNLTWEKTYDEHKEIVDAIEAHDFERAKKAAIDHITTTEKIMMKIMGKDSE